MSEEVITNLNNMQCKITKSRKTTEESYRICTFTFTLLS